VKSAKVYEKYIREPHLAAIFGSISYGRRALIIIINPKLDMPCTQVKEKNSKTLLFRLFEKSPVIFITIMTLIVMAVICNK
jgi:hypothetical protein